MNTVVRILIVLLILGVGFWAIRELVAALALPPVVGVVAIVLLVVVAVLYLVRALKGSGGIDL